MVVHANVHRVNVEEEDEDYDDVLEMEQGNDGEDLKAVKSPCCSTSTSTSTERQTACTKAAPPKHDYRNRTGSRCCD